MNEQSFTSKNLDPELDRDSYDVGIKASPISIVKRRLRQAYMEGGEDGLVSKALSLVTYESVSRNLIELSILGLNVPVKVAGDSYSEFIKTLDALKEPPAIELTELDEWTGKR